ncbi:hypothetical protein [Sphaerobacter thermophilus]|jgi:high-affinity nickel-transport protein|uniref:Nickel/cobalt efflux system n=1 Tax=Sphaerobacter thermophilus (strain ATCC 49802 / DSM 20745 / KCCM 41009 / NCIMB 13125 / S 6022) TaxID=479434 RepID=D1C4T4_SPHTD|nr:hypothetical protein [Sphaerobacter thermophilus]ACZ39251.1 hypothetical protein Sthe_1818 [Sphaerobacter thermophilus DSM 20745]PZN62953.1 MAG: hypothetical protein DIU58_11525 [Sphaerobacter thermophilus]
MADLGALALIATGLGLGLRHGIDWDHIAAITDITGTMDDEELVKPVQGGADGVGAATLAPSRRYLTAESRHRFFLATLYAVGHALVVVVLGLIALWTSTILPDWIDPIMERVVGVTLLVLGGWILYSLWRHGRDFQLRSRWMLVFAAVGNAWAWLRSRLRGERYVRHDHWVSSYGWKTALGIGMIHGIGAETGSQALLLAATAGATTKVAGSVLLVAFVVGLVISNSIIAALTTFGFVSSSTRRTVFVVIGLIAGVFSLFLGFLFTTGIGVELPDLQELIDRVI